MTRIITILSFICLYTVSYGQVEVPAGSNNYVKTDSSSAPVYNLTVAAKDNSKVSLKWRSVSFPEESFFAIERSINGTDFNPVSVIKKTQGEDFEFIDDSPVRGKIYYRVKFTSSQAVFYSDIISVVVSADASCRFYPNPVDKLLIVRSDIAVDVQIADRFGKPLISTRLEAGPKLVDVSSLAPGVYIITLFQKDSNRIVTEKLVKK